MRSTRSLRSLAGLLALVVELAASAETPVAGGTLGDTTWVAANSPYHLTGTVVVGRGATLTIEPGVRVIIDYGFTVEGTILALGTEALPIELTGSSTEAGAWSGLLLQGSPAMPIAGSRLEHVIVRGGGRSGPSVGLRYARASIVGCTILSGASDGIRGLAGGVADVSDTEVRGQAGYALRFDDAGLAPTLSGITAVDNGVDRVALGGGTIPGTWTLRDVLPYDVLGTITVPAGGELVVEPGVELYFQTVLDVRGALVAVGTADAPITFGSNDATPGGWDGISILGTPSALSEGSRLEHVRIEWARLWLRWAKATVAHALIRGSPSDGLRGSNQAGVDLFDVRLEDNAEYAIRLDDPELPSRFAAITATRNGLDRIALGGGALPGTRELDGVLPYDVLGTIVVPKGARLILFPGVELQASHDLRVEGTIDVRGTAAKPVLIRGDEARPGAWGGLSIVGTPASPNVGSTLEHLTLADGGGSGANLYLRFASARVSDAILSGSSKDGVLLYHGGGTLIERTAFLDNGGHDDYAVRNSTPDELVFATHDWWGAATGPDTEDACNPAGGGARVSSGVIYQPFLETHDADPGPVPSLGTLDLSLAPARWFVPADGASASYVKITLRDGLGVPVSGRRVELSSTRGNVTAGGLTDIRGESWAIVRSSAAGDAVLRPSLGDGAACEPSRASTATITFVARDENPLMSDAEAPYMTHRLEVSPRPLVQGRPATLRATLANPADVDISVNADFGYAQLGIGLVFGPIGSVTGAIIPAHGEKTLELSWTPLISGHFCLRMTYDAQPTTTGSGLIGVSRRGAGGSGTASANADAEPANMTNEEQDDAIDEANEAMHAAHVASVAINGMEVLEHGAPSPFWMPEILAGFIAKWNLERGREISDAMKGNESVHRPRRPIVHQITGGLVFDGASYWELPRARSFELPVLLAGAEVSERKAAAYNAWLRSGVEGFSELEAMATAQLRNVQASNAGELDWASQQASAYFFFQARAAAALIRFGDDTQALLAVLADEGMSTDVIGAEAWRAFQDSLRADGFGADDLAAAELLGFTADEIEAYRQRLLAQTPEALAGDRLAALALIGEVWRKVGVALSMPPPYAAQQITGAGLSESAGQLARLFPSASSFVLGNPSASRATVELRVRRLSLPDDWTIALDPERAELGPSETTTVTVTILPGSSVAQGTVPRVAVEGYAGGELLGGVVIDTLVPRYVPAAAGCVGRGAKLAGEGCACTMDCRLGLECLDAVCGVRPSPSPSPSPTPSPAPDGSDEGCGCASGGADGLALAAVMIALLARRRARA